MVLPFICQIFFSSHENSSIPHVLLCWTGWVHNHKLPSPPSIHTKSRRVNSADCLMFDSRRRLSQEIYWPIHHTSSVLETKPKREIKSKRVLHTDTYRWMERNVHGCSNCRCFEVVRKKKGNMKQNRTERKLTDQNEWNVSLCFFFCQRRHLFIFHCSTLRSEFDNYRGTTIISANCKPSLWNDWEGHMADIHQIIDKWI